MDALRWDGWSELDDDARLASASSVVTTLRRKGLELGEPALHAFGPPDAAWMLAVIRDERTGVVFSLAPGGTLRPGLSEASRAAFWELQRAWLADRPMKHELPYTAKEWSPEQLWGRESVEVGPMLIALQPLTARVLGVEPARSASRPLLRFEEALEASARLSYSLPSSDELEWCTNASSQTLFPWGDELPYPMDPREPLAAGEYWDEATGDFDERYLGLSADPIAPWPTANIFGLQGTAGQPVWCMGPRDEGLVTGGAARFSPWQACGEWLWMLGSLRVEADAIDRHQGAMCRPVIRIPG